VASFRSRLFRLAVRYLVRVPLETCGASEAEYVATARRVFELGAARNANVGSGVRVVPIDVDGIRGEWVVAGDARTVERAILYAHGGAYVACRPLGYRRFAAELARATGAAVFVLDYRRAPEHRYPAALDDAVAAYDALRERLAPENVALAGDSAGGNLALATLLALRERDGLARPVASVTLFSPWTDLTASGASVTENAASDDMIPPGPGNPALIYAGGASLEDPLVSPLFGSYLGGPPMLAFASTIEVLRDDSVRLIERARRDGVEATLVLERDMPHVWPIFGAVVPESRRALVAAAAFIARSWAAKEIPV
jgi:acetyl esterase/lipase